MDVWKMVWAVAARGCGGQEPKPLRPSCRLAAPPAATCLQGCHCGLHARLAACAHLRLQVRACAAPARCPAARRRRSSCRRLLRACGSRPACSRSCAAFCLGSALPPINCAPFWPSLQGQRRRRLLQPPGQAVCGLPRQRLPKGAPGLRALHAGPAHGRRRAQRWVACRPAGPLAAAPAAWPADAANLRRMASRMLHALVAHALPPAAALRAAAALLFCCTP